jgi:hypothetical protein
VIPCPVRFTLRSGRQSVTRSVVGAAASPSSSRRTHSATLPKVTSTYGSCDGQLAPESGKCWSMSSLTISASEGCGASRPVTRERFHDEDCSSTGCHWFAGGRPDGRTGGRPCAGLAPPRSRRQRSPTRCAGTDVRQVGVQELTSRAARRGTFGIPGFRPSACADSTNPTSPPLQRPGSEHPALAFTAIMPWLDPADVGIRG